jgi:mevalonate pyrophosphate decarboxylase
MLKRLFVVTGLIGVASSTACAATCGEALAPLLERSEQQVQLLRLDRPGQLRVSGPEGSAYTGGQVIWLRAQLRSARKECTEGKVEAAQRRLSEVRRLL